MLKNSLNILIVIITALYGVVLCPTNSWCSNTKNILILNTDSSSQGKLFHGMKSVFNDVDDMEINISKEYTDLTILSKKSGYEPYIKNLSKKYSGTNFDLVMTGDLISFNLAIKARNSFLKNVPIIFCGINQFSKRLYENIDNVTGVIKQVDIADTLKVALDLHPQTWRVYVINDDKISDICYAHALKKAFKSYQDKVDFVLINNVTKKNVLHKLSKASNGTIVLMLSCLKNSSKKAIHYHESIRIVSTNTNMPIYGIDESFMGHGLVGGKICDTYNQGRKAAEQALAYFKGKSIRSIPVSDNSVSEFMFDYNQLKKYNIKKFKLPKNSLIINMPPPFFRLDSKSLIAALIFIFIQTSVIIFLISNITRTKKSTSKIKGNIGFLEEEVRIQTKELRSVRTQLTESTIKYAKLNNLLSLNEEKYRILFEASGEAIIIIHKNKIVDCNIKAMELYQYQKEELITMHIDDFFDSFGPYKQLFSKIVAKTNSFTIRQGSKSIYECYSKKKDGNMFYAELVFSPMKIADEIYIQVIIRDITSIKKIEENVVTSRRLLEAANKHASIHSILEDFSAEILKMQKEATVGICLVTNSNKLICSGNKLCRTLGVKGIKPKVCSDFCTSYLQNLKDTKYITPWGSFFSNDITNDWENFPENVKRNLQLLNENFGYISMALIPVKDKSEIKGFIRIMDTKQIHPDKVSMFENVALQLQIAFQRSAEIKDKHNMITELEEAKKQETIGSLSTGLIHEINTPLQLIGDNIEFLSGAVDDLLYLVNQYKDIIQNLLNGEQTDIIADKTKLLNDEVDVEFLQNELPTAVNQSQQGVNQVSRIIKAMREFSMCKTAELTVADINKAISNVIIITNNEWKYIADIKTDFSQDLPLIPCYIGEISYMILILLLNSISSIKNSAKQKGAINILTLHVEDNIVIQIRDNGAGVPNHLQDKIFDPIFSVKEYNDGFGQGLSLAYEIVVEKHNGKITVTPNANEGTLFTVELPLDQPRKIAKKTGMMTNERI